MRQTHDPDGWSQLPTDDDQNTSISHIGTTSLQTTHVSRTEFIILKKILEMIAEFSFHNSCSRFPQSAHIFITACMQQLLSQVSTH
jgi:hypothetical protein